VARGFKRPTAARIPRWHSYTGGLEHNNIVRSRFVSRYRSRMDLFGDANIAIQMKRGYRYVSVDKGLSKANKTRPEVDNEFMTVHGI